MSPYLRPLDSTAPIPKGWTIEPAGPWNGQEVEVVSNPTRHDVMLVRGQTWLWYRDRLVAARNNLERTQGAAAVRSTVIGL